MKIRDERANETNTVLQGIRILKYFAWEKKVQQKLEEIRKRELIIIRNKIYLSCLADSSMWPIFPMISTNLLFLLYIMGYFFLLFYYCF
jgi:hypothetical protein